MPLSVLGALSSLFGSTYAVDKQNEAIDKQIEAQRDENDKTRQYNLNLAKMQNQWNIDQYNRENAYNTPAAQMQRFKAAGLNPNLIYGQVNNTPVSIAGSLSSGAPAIPADMSALGGKRSGLASMFSQLGKSLLEIPMYKAEVEGKRLDNDLKRQELFEKQTTAAARFEGIDLQNQSLRSQIENVQRSTALLEDTAANVRANTANVEADTVLKQINSIVMSNESAVRIRQMEAQTKLTDAQCKEILTLLPAQLLGYKLENDNLQKYGIKVDAETKQIKFDYTSDLEWKDQERTLNAWDYIIGYARDIASIVGTAFGGNYSETMTNSVKDGVQTVTRKGKRR